MSADREERLKARARELFREAEGNPHRLAMIAAQFSDLARGRPDAPLEVVGGVGVTGRPYVQLSWGEQSGQLAVDDARAHALLLLEAAQNAIGDAALLEWARSELDLDLDRAASLINALRTYRRDRWGQPDLRVEFSHPPPEEEPG